MMIKNSTKFRLFSLPALALLLLFSSCEKDKSTETPPTTPPIPSMSIEIENVVPFGTGNNFTTLKFDTFYVNAAADTFSVSMFKYFLSNIRLIKADGTEQKIPNTYFLVDHAKPASKMLDLFDVPEGNYTGIRFTIGIDDVTHTLGTSPSAFTIAQNNGMWWPDWGEYIHLKLEGTIKPLEEFYQIHIGGYQGSNTNFKDVQLAFDEGGGNLKELIVVSGKKPVLHLNTNLMEMFLDSSNNPIGLVSTTVSGPDATQFANGYSNMIIYSHLHNE
ncbi:MAG: MbnP family protein [Bacteroidota bacterium]|jgi:hypothetical protein